MKRILCLFIALLICGALLTPLRFCSAESYLTPTPEELTDRDETAIDLTPVINAMVMLLGDILIAAIGIAVLPTLKRWLQAHASKDQQDRFWQTVVVLVNAAEQIFIRKGMGPQKMDWVVDQLRQRGFDADTAAIEAAVHEMNSGVLRACEGVLLDTEPPVEVDEDYAAEVRRTVGSGEIYSRD